MLSRQKQKQNIFRCIQGAATLLQCPGQHLVFLIISLTLGQSLKAGLEFQSFKVIYIEH